MRNGYYEKKKTRNPRKYGRTYRTQNPAGYYKVYEPGHPLADSAGTVYEHRFIYYRDINNEVTICDKCSDDVTWDTCHIDHVDDDVENNAKENLRCLCRPCNVFRGHSNTSMGKMFLTINGVTNTPAAWARTQGVRVAHNTISRRKRNGWSDFDAVYGEKITHKSTVASKSKCKYDKERGISLKPVRQEAA